MKPFTVILMSAALMILLGCSDSKVVLQAATGGKKLVYDPSNFLPQVETPEDIAILVGAAIETVTNAISNKELITAQEISEAMSANDIRKLEKAVVAYRAAHQK